MSLFGKMNQTEEANDDGIIRKTTMAEQVAEGQQSFISHRATSRSYLPTYPAQDIASGARRCCRLDVVASSNILLYCWRCGTELRVCRRRIVRVEATVIPGAVRF